MTFAIARRTGATALIALAFIVLWTYGTPPRSLLAHLSRYAVHIVERSSKAVSVHVTTADASRLFAEDESPPIFSNAPTGKLPVLSVEDGKRFQVIDGFGAELTGSSAYVLAALPDRGASLLRELFDSDTGIGLSYVRLTVGASDFSLGSYTYDDVAPGATDPALASFSVARDAEVFSVLQAIRATSSDVRFMASPWTAPAWMKSGRKLFGGELLSSSYGVYAKYLVSYVRALKDRGITLDALTPQNEPLLDAAAYPSMTLSASAEAAFVRTALGPAMQTVFPETKLVVNDHNWDEGSYPLTILGDAGASRYVAGSAFHCYGGNVSQMSRVHEAYPQKPVYLTECSGGAWSTSFRNNLSWDTQNLIVGGTRNWAQTVLLGNLALDDAAGPTNGGCANCRGLVTIHADASVTRNVEYYVLAHAAKFVRPGAVRIASSSSIDKALPNVAFVNVDGSKVLIVFNASKGRATFAVRFQSASFRYSLPSGAIATFRWT